MDDLIDRFRQCFGAGDTCRPHAEFWERLQGPEESNVKYVKEKARLARRLRMRGNKFTLHGAIQGCTTTSATTSSCYIRRPWTRSGRRQTLRTPAPFDMLAPRRPCTRRQQCLHPGTRTRLRTRTSMQRMRWLEWTTRAHHLPETTANRHGTTTGSCTLPELWSDS